MKKALLFALVLPAVCAYAKVVPQPRFQGVDLRTGTYLDSSPDLTLHSPDPVHYYRTFQSDEMVDETGGVFHLQEETVSINGEQAHLRTASGHMVTIDADGANNPHYRFTLRDNQVVIQTGLGQTRTYSLLHGNMYRLASALSHTQYLTTYQYDRFGHIAQVEQSDPSGAIVGTIKVSDQGDTIHVESSQGDRVVYQFDSTRQVGDAVVNTLISYDRGSDHIEVDYYKGVRLPKGSVMGLGTVTIDYFKPGAQPYRDQRIKLARDDTRVGKVAYIKTSDGEWWFDYIGDTTVVYSADDTSKYRFADDRMVENDGQVYEWSPAGLLTTMTADDTVTTYTYDEWGYCTSETVNGETTAWTYSDTVPGQMVAVSKGDQLTQFRYTPQGLLSSETVTCDGQISTIVEYGYDHDGHLNQITRQQGDHTTTTTFEGPQSHPHFTRVEVDGVFVSHHVYTYNDNGDILTDEMVDQDGRVGARCTNEYDSQGRLAVSVDRHGVARFYDYTPQGKTITSCLGEEQIVYDAEGRIVSCRMTDAAGHETLTTNTYDNGYLASSTCGDIVKTYSEGLLQSVSDGVNVVSYAYNDEGQLLSISGDGFTYNYSYDGMTTLIENNGQLTIRTLDDKGRLVYEKLENGLELRYAYDWLDRLAEIVFSDRSKIVYSYDPFNLVKVARVSAKGAENYAARFEQYDAMGHPTTVVLPVCEEQVVYSYDHTGRCDGLETNRYSYSGAPASYTARDRDGEYTNFDMDHTNTAVATFDSLGRPIEVAGEEQRVTYTYDPFGRRMTKTAYMRDLFGWKAHSVRRYLWAATLDLGAGDKSGKPYELRLVAHNTTFAVELEGTPLGVICDPQGSVTTLVKEKESVESYRYSDQGDALIRGGMLGRTIPTSAYRNPWQYKGERVDEEHGCRYRWASHPLVDQADTAPRLP